MNKAEFVFEKYAAKGRWISRARSGIQTVKGTGRDVIKEFAKWKKKNPKGTLKQFNAMHKTAAFANAGKLMMSAARRFGNAKTLTTATGRAKALRNYKGKKKMMSTLAKPKMGKLPVLSHGQKPRDISKLMHG